MPSTLIAETADGTCSISPTCAGQRVADRGLGDVVGGHRRRGLALGVVGGGRDAEPDRGVVRLLGEHQVAEQPGGAVDAEHQHAGRHRVEGAGVADLAGAGQPPDPGDHVVRGHPAGLVDDDQAGLAWSSARDLVGRSSSSTSRGLRYGSSSPAYVAPADEALTAASCSRALASSSSMWRAFSGQRVLDELERRRVPHPELLGDLGPDQSLGRLQRRRRAGEVVSPRRSTV